MIETMNAKIINTSLEVKNDRNRNDINWSIHLCTAERDLYFNSDGVEKLCHLLCTLTEENDSTKEWEELPGMHVRVKMNKKNDEVISIGNFMEDKWFKNKEE